MTTRRAGVLMIVVGFLGLVGCGSPPSTAGYQASSGESSALPAPPTTVDDPAPAATPQPAPTPTIAPQPQATPIRVEIPTPAPLPQLLPPAVKTQTFTGSGDQVVNLAAPVPLGVLIFECPRCTSNTSVKFGDGDLYVNVIGPYSGTSLIGGSNGAAATRLEISAGSDWRATVGGIDMAKAFSGRSPVTGGGNQVLVLRPTPDVATFSHTGEGNAAVVVYSLDGSYLNLAFNEIGNYKGTAVLGAGGADAIVEVRAQGPWTLSPG